MIPPAPPVNQAPAIAIQDLKFRYPEAGVDSQVWTVVVGRLLLQQPTFAVHAHEPWGLVPAVVFCSGLVLLVGAGLERAVRGVVKRRRKVGL